MILLNENEITKEVGWLTSSEYNHYKNIAKLQAIKLLNELEKPCPHEPYKCLEVKRCDCYICLEEIRKEITDVP